MPDDDDPDAPTTALRELFRIERLTGVPVGPAPTYPAAPHHSPVLLVEPPAMPSSILRAIAARPEPALLVIDRPKASGHVEPEPLIDVILPVAVIRGPVGRGVGHTAMCRLLDSPARKRGWPFICICGRDRP